MKMTRWFGLSALFLAGCPIYGDDGYVTPRPYGSATCSSPDQCATGSVCDVTGTCRVGGCDVHGCVSPYQCVVENGSATCKVDAPPPSRDAGTDAKPFSGCRSDAECTASKGAGAKCLSGECASVDNQCTDATQCRGAQQCVEGSCTPSCSTTVACPTGYACDTAKGVCTLNPQSCTSSASCGNGKACVESRCVPSCTDASQCSGGLLCVDGGCVPDERPVFSCSQDGQVGTGAAGACAVGSICLRKSCYISCDPLAADACKSADAFNQCKKVTTSSGEHDVCGSTSNLGSECDLSASKPCSGSLICIDGYCR